MSDEPVRRAFKDTVGVPSKVDATVFAQNSFFFQQRRGKLDMRSLARVDVERVIEDCDVGTLQLHLENLTFADLTTDDMVSYTDEHFLKLFRLSQLTIEYLLNVQNALLTYSRSVEEETERLKGAAEEGERRLQARRSKVHSLKRSMRQQAQTLKTYETLLKQQQQQQQQQAPPSNQAPSPGGGSMMTASDGTQYVSVEYLKRKAAASGGRAQAAEKEEKRRREEEERKERAMEEKFQALQKQMEEAKNATRVMEEKKTKESEVEKLEKKLEEERLARSVAEQEAEKARMTHDERVEEVRREVDEKMRSMKAMMEAELRDQRMIMQQQQQQQRGSGGDDGVMRSNAGEMESDSDDELHDRESMGTMRRSKRELAKMVSEQQAELDLLKSQREGMRSNMIEKYISAKQRARTKHYKTIGFDGWKDFVRNLSLERQALSLRVQHEDSGTEETVPPPPLEEEVPLRVAAPKRTGKMFVPSYSWTKCSKTATLPYEQQLEFRDQQNPETNETWEEVRIPPMWELPLEFAATTGSVRITLPVHRATTVMDILDQCVVKLQSEHQISTSSAEGPGSLCLLGTSNKSHHGHLLSREETSTVESNSMFLQRPRLVLFSGMTDKEVEEIVRRFTMHVDKRLSKNKNRLKKNVRAYMEIQDEAVTEELTAAGKLTDEHICSLCSPLKSHESTQFRSVLSRFLHEENDIDDMQNEIVSMLKEELSGVGLKKKRAIDGTGKKKIRGMTEFDYEALMEEEWHMTGQGWPTTRASTPQDTTSANTYFRQCVEAEQTRAMEDVASNLTEKKNFILEARRGRVERLTRMLTTVKGTKNMTQAERKGAIKQMFHKLHGHYFSKLFNVLDESKRDGGGGSRGSGGETKGSIEEDDMPIVPSRGSPRGSPTGSSTGSSANLLRQSATINFIPSRTPAAEEAGNTGATENAAASGETKEASGETKETNSSRTSTTTTTTTTRRQVPTVPVDDSMNESQEQGNEWDGLEDDEEEDDERSRIARMADAYEQGSGSAAAGSAGNVSVTSISSLNDSVVSLGRGGASPGARRTRTSGGEALEEYDEDLDGSWDGEE